MARREKAYRRLPGRARRLMGSTTLWMGRDHLLLVEGRGYTETYRRFYYRDIQFVLTRRSNRAVVLSLVFAVLLAGVATAAWLTGREFLMFWAIPGGCFLLLLLINLAKGPTCLCDLRTGVQTARLDSLHRLRKARKAIGRLRRSIDEAQGSLSAEEIRTRAAEAAPSETAVPLSASKPPTSPKPVHRASGRVHAILFALLLADAAVSSVALLQPQTTLTVAGLLLLLAEFGSVITAIVQQRGSDLPQTVRGTTWSVLVFLCTTVMISLIVGFVREFTRAIQNLGSARPAWSQNPNPKIAALFIPGALLLGLFGLICLLRFRRDRSQAELSIFSGAQRDFREP